MSRMYVYPDFVRVRGKFGSEFLNEITTILQMNGFENTDPDVRDLGLGYNTAKWCFGSADQAIEASDVIADYFEHIRRFPELIIRICIPSCGDERWLSIPSEESGAGAENAATCVFNIQDSTDLQSEDVISRIAQCVKSHLADVEKSSVKEHQNKTATFTPVIVVNSDPLPMLFCPSTECNECKSTCTSSLQRAGAHHSQVSGADYRDCHVAACNECEAMLCSVDCQHQRAIANAQREYDAALENLKRAEANIQKVVNAHG